MIPRSRTVTIFVCVKLRDQKKSSCSGCGSRDLLDQLRAELPADASEHVVIRPSGCLKKCKKGPAVVLFRTKHDALKKPPKKAWKRADARLKRVRKEDARKVLEAARALADRFHIVST